MNRERRARAWAGAGVLLLGMIAPATPAGAQQRATVQVVGAEESGEREGSTTRNAYTVETTGRIPEGGLLLESLPRAAYASSSRLVLSRPNLGTATRVAEAINQSVGAGTATVEDPGSITLTLAADPAAGAAVMMACINGLTVEPHAAAQILVNTRDRTVVAGGDVTVGRAAVSHGGGGGSARAGGGEP